MCNVQVFSLACSCAGGSTDPVGGEEVKPKELCVTHVCISVLLAASLVREDTFIHPHLGLMPLKSLDLPSLKRQV